MTNGFEPKQKNPGDLILSADWNAAMGEIDRLGNTLKDIKQKATSFQGPLTIAEALNVKGNVGIGTDTPTAKLEVKGNLKLELGEAVNEFSSDITLADNSNQAVPTQLAVKTYVEHQVQGVKASARESFETKKLQVSETLTVEGATQLNGSLQLGQGVQVAQFSDTIGQSRESSLVVVPTQLAVKNYVDNKVQGLDDSLKAYIIKLLYEPKLYDIKIESFKLAQGVILEMAYIPGGMFLMGSPISEFRRSDDEGPQHLVNVSGFWMGQFPVTQQQWQAVADYNKVKATLQPKPSYFKGDNLPVEKVSWNDCQEFCARLNKKFKGQLQGRKFRLPSEAEWEYACRAGTTTRYYYGDDESKLGEYAWYSGNSDSKTHPAVKEKTPNNWELYDMIGNVWEWCEDTWHDNYDGAPVDGIPWIDNYKSYRLLRGGSWYRNPKDCSCANRYGKNPGDSSRKFDLGFRVVCS
ncbi:MULTISPECIES: formylglycine-generating enzyme family protein [unclassified Moorena]|uniref:formylglycine-generating enzyme family protein n=1 Tax=unclassified Moorena TaxID=2683338 RepID=UPI0013BF9081|nr:MULTISPECIES: formylglycine-generating enzyme family protein [unclassified Moorena]NEO07881.1 formylglycine-generating enzyme family protein [Moorena sp. SIO3I8]NEP25196.1 formylglycine-generating enzyme family protein [Moorena sp. SIO3I6]